MNRLTVLLLSGFIAGSVATMVQLLLWWLSGAAVATLLLRDSCLTAAIVLGTGVLTPPLAWSISVLLSATLIHLIVSFAWALPATLYTARSRSPAMLAIAGMVYGVFVYLVDLYGFTYLFPWFAISRGVNTLFAHVAFGLMLFIIGHRFQAKAK